MVYGLAAGCRGTGLRCEFYLRLYLRHSREVPKEKGVIGKGEDIMRCLRSNGSLRRFWYSRTEAEEFVAAHPDYFGDVRDRTRYCYACRPIAKSRYVGMHPRSIAKLPPEERDEAWAARRYVPDRRGMCAIEERIFDLTAGPVVGEIN